MTLGTVLDPGGGNLLFAAKGGLFKGQRDAGADIFALPGTVSPSGTAGGTAAKEIVENAAQIHIEAAEPAAKSAAEATACGIVGVNSGKAVLVIPGAFVGIGQNLIGLAHFLELLLGFLIAGVQVGMIFLGQLSVGLLYFIVAGGFVNPQDFIIISFLCICHDLTSLFPE